MNRYFSTAMYAYDLKASFYSLYAEAVTRPSHMIGERADRYRRSAVSPQVPNISSLTAQSHPVVRIHA